MLSFALISVRFRLLLLTAGGLLVSYVSYSQPAILQYARTVIDTLASPSMHGRGYVNKGDSIAADYIKKKFEKFDLNPIQKEFYQKFSLNINTFPTIVQIESKEKKYIVGKDYILQGASGSLKGSFKTVLLNSKTFNSKKSKNKFNSTDFSNTAILVDKAEISKMKEGIKLLEFLTLNAFKAKAVLLIEDIKLTAGYSQKEKDFPVITFLRTAIDPIPDTLYFNIQNKFLSNYETQNVIGYVKGTHYPDSFIVFSAHYDHLGRMGKDSYFPGANDNASGVAMLLSLAQHYKQNPPKFSIAFIAFGAEEAGLVGSKYYVEHPLFALAQIKFLINMDILGTGDEGIKVVNATEHKKEFDALVKINSERNLLTSVQSRGKAANSDHFPFSEKGVKTFFIYTLGGIKAYHDIYDRSQTLPLTKFEEVYNLLWEFTDYLQK